MGVLLLNEDPKRSRAVRLRLHNTQTDQLTPGRGRLTLTQHSPVQYA